MKKKNPQFLLLISALGIVYGDIGTSPLYALKSCFAAGDIPVTPENIVGIISIICWALILVVTVKYVALVMRVDEQGEGGILVLSNLTGKLKIGKLSKYPFMFGILGAALFFGDGIITPAISILSALEGLGLVSHFFKPHILWISCVVLIILFLLQKRGSQSIGHYFGPIMALWFMTIIIMGAYNILKAPEIFLALNPYYALKFFYIHKLMGLAVLGGTILVVTGAEALYADMGHFGKRPIILSWTYFVLPALLLNYLGQGSLLITNPAAITNPFYFMVPDYFYYPLVALSTIATIVASQAVISGVFSVGWQGIMLGYLPRMKVIHTSYSQRGEVYVPALNTVLAILTIGAVLKFQTSDNLAVAYGLSVAGVMLLTIILVCTMAYHQWKWPLWKLLAVFTPLILMDTVFVATNFIKIFEGAWYAFTIAALVIYVINVWMRGNKALNRQKFNEQGTLANFLKKWSTTYPQRIPGTAIFMSRSPNKVPNSLVVHLNHNKLLHEKMIFISIQTSHLPREHCADKFTYKSLGGQNTAVVVKYGFKEIPDFHKIRHFIEEKGVIAPDEKLSFFLSKSIAVRDNRGALKGFAEKLYIFLTRNSLPAYEFYKIPHDRVVELGIRYKI